MHNRKGLTKKNDFSFNSFNELCIHIKMSKEDLIHSTIIFLTSCIAYCVVVNGPFLVDDLKIFAQNYDVKVNTIINYRY